MKTKRFLFISACCLMALTLAGCGDGRVQDTVSKVGDEISGAVSRVESALDPDSNGSSGFPDESGQSSMPDYESSQGGGINSGSSDIENGTESGGDISSAGDASSHVDTSSARDKTKDI